MNKDNLYKTHYIYCQPIYNGIIKLINRTLYIYESVDAINNFVKLQTVPELMRNIIFVAFFSNPISAHFDAYYKFN